MNIVEAVQILLFDASGWIVDAATVLPGVEVDVEILGDSDCNDPGDSTPKQKEKGKKYNLVQKSRFSQEISILSTLCIHENANGKDNNYYLIW